MIQAHVGGSALSPPGWDLLFSRSGELPGSARRQGTPSSSPGAADQGLVKSVLPQEDEELTQEYISS